MVPAERGLVTYSVEFRGSARRAIAAIWPQQELEIPDVYKGVDFRFYRGRQGAEYDWIVAPHADPTVISLGFPASTRLAVDVAGNLEIQYPDVSFRHNKPVAFQETAGIRTPVEARWELLGRDCATFRIGPYDRSRILVIDPVIAYSVGFGGTKRDPAYDIPKLFAVDREGASYFAGVASTADFPVTADAFQHERRGQNDIFVSRVSKDGNRLEFSTLLGGSSTEEPTALAVDNNGDIYVASVTRSGDFPGAGGAGFAVSKISGGSGRLVYTYGWPGRVNAIVPRPDGSILLAGAIRAKDIPAVPGAYQATFQSSLSGFVAKLDAEGKSLQLMTYFSGSDEESVSALGLDAAGNIYLAGVTLSSDLPTTSGAFQSRRPPCIEVICDDLFVAKFSPDGSRLLYSTYIGGNYRDFDPVLAVDEAGHAFLAATTWSRDFPTTPDSFQPSMGTALTSSFILKLSTDGTSLVYSTYVGSNTYPKGIAINGEGEAHVAYYAIGVPLPEVEPPQTGPGEPRLGRFCRNTPWSSTSDLSPCLDGYLVILSALGDKLRFASFLGDNEHDQLIGIGFAPNGDVMVGGGALIYPPATLIFGFQEASTFVTRIRREGTAVNTRPEWLRSPDRLDAPVTRPSLTPGSLRSLFGVGLAESPGTRIADTDPLPQEIDGVWVEVGDRNAPLLAVSSQEGLDQINFVVPREVFPKTFPAGNFFIPVTVHNNGARSITFWLSASSGGAPSFLRQPDGLAYIRHLDGTLVDRSNPAKRGEVVEGYGSGNDLVEPPVLTGEAAPDSPPSHNVRTHRLDVGRIPATVLFTGLMPGSSSLYMVRFQIPETAPSGEVELRTLTPDGLLSQGTYRTVVD
ncbi:MAG: SBBP repeat-containing protein [Bryobacteraceae bacterium]